METQDVTSFKGCGGITEENMRKRIIVKCQNCQKERSIDAHGMLPETYSKRCPICHKCGALKVRDRISKGWFGTRPPWNKGKKGLQMAWNKGTKGIMKVNSGSFTSKRTLGEKNCNWKGDNVGYDALHSWIRRKLGKADKCSECGKTSGVQWANKSHEYKRDLLDWEKLCNRCHKIFDGYIKINDQVVRKIRILYKSGLSQKNIAKQLVVHQSQISRVINNKIGGIWHDAL